MCTAYSSQPFIDGRTYESICWTCSQVPKTWEFDEATSTLIINEVDPTKLCTVEDMVEEGFNKEEAAASIKGVKKCLKNAKAVIVTKGAIYDEIFFQEET